MKKDAPEQTTVLEQKPLSLILDEIEARANKATQGPWYRDPTGDTGTWLIGTTESPVADCGFGAELTGSEIDGNAAFVASARTDVPALVKALRHSLERFAFVAPRSMQVKLNIEITAILNQK